MKTPRQDLGQWGETLAAEYLQAHGYTILERNVHTAHGEIDIVASKEGSTIFVEVKTRKSSAFANPEDSVSSRKQAFLMFAAETYFNLHPDSPESWQFDVIAIIGQPGKKVQIEHFENVIA